MGINLAIKTVILAIMLNAYLQTCRPVCKKLQTGLQTDCRPVADRLQKVADRSYKGPIHRSQITLDHTPLPTANSPIALSPTTYICWISNIHNNRVRIPISLGCPVLITKAGTFSPHKSTGAIVISQSQQLN